MRAAPAISVAVPLLDEEGNVEELLRRLTAVLSTLPGGPHEIVLVDDGSTDRTVERARAFDTAPIALTIASLSRNFGHQAAYTAALDLAAGDVVILMDGDLQDPPETIPRFVELYREGCDVVYARRATREAPWHMRLAYGLFYRLIDWASDIRMPLDTGDFSLLARPVVDAIRSSPERHRYLRGLRAWAGHRQIGIDIDRPSRHEGTSKYSVYKLLVLAFDGLFAFSRVPLRIATLFGAISLAASALYALYSLYAKVILHQSPQGFTALILAIIFFAGVQLIFLGVIGEYIGRIYTEVKGRPHYLVSDLVRKGGNGTALR